MTAMALGRLHVLTDYHFQQRFSHADLCRLAIEGGADVVQFRQKFGGIRHRLREARRAAQVCREAGMPFVVNDSLDIALAVGADGIHLGQADFPLSEARRLLPDNFVIGATAATPAEARRAYDEGATYVGFGPVFPTGSKANPVPVRGVDGLATVCSAVSIPVIAIAGITADRVATVMEAGAYGIAVMTAVSVAEDPAAATREIRAALDESLSRS